MSKRQCKVCEKETKVVFNIDFKATPICNDCARQIAKQEIDWMFSKDLENENEDVSN